MTELKLISLIFSRPLYIFAERNDLEQDTFSMEIFKMSGTDGTILWQSTVASPGGRFSPLKGKLLSDRLMVVAQRSGHYILHQMNLAGETITTTEKEHPAGTGFNKGVAYSFFPRLL